MSSKRNVFVSGILAVVVAGILLLASTLGGFAPQLSVPGGTNQTTGGGVNPNGPGSGTTTTQGMLTLLVTDPPMVPDGVSSLYLQYDQVLVHSSSATPDVWVPLNVSGTVDSMSLVNVSQTIASINVAAGSYDSIRFHLTAVQITLNGSTYAVVLSSDNVTASLQGSIHISGSQAATTIIDIQPTVIEVGTSDSPQFVFNAHADLFDLSAANLTSMVSFVGSRMNLTGMTWWNGVQLNESGSLQITSASISANSLALTVKNTGNVTQYISLVMISAPSAMAVMPGRYQPGYRLPVATESIMFSVQADGSLQMIMVSRPPVVPADAVAEVFSQAGYVLAPGATASFSYSGTVIGGTQNPLPSTYLVTVVGSTAQATVPVPVQ